MGESFNPYAPPGSEIVPPSTGSGASGDGGLVRIELEGQLPDRCIRCNGPAEGYRLERSLYWRPVWWKWTSWGSVLLTFTGGMANPIVLIAFWPVVICVWVADLFVRRKVVVEVGLCRGHRRVRQGLMAGFAVSWAVIIALVAATFNGYRAMDNGLFWIVVLGMFLLGVAVSLLYRVGVKQVIGEHLWLQGAGRPFVHSLPAVTN